MGIILNSKENSLDTVYFEVQNLAFMIDFHRFNQRLKGSSILADFYNL